MNIHHAWEIARQLKTKAKRPSLKKRKVRCAIGEDGSAAELVPVDAWVSNRFPGLAVHSSRGLCGEPEKWSVTHIDSGKALNNKFESKKAAVDFADDVANYINFAMSETALVASAAYKKHEKFARVLLHSYDKTFTV